MLKQNQFRWREIETLYFTTGEGFPVVWIHGFPSDHSLWVHQHDLLKENFLNIFPDLPGSGLSETLPGADNLETYAEFINDLLESLGIKRCIMLGHSMGGYITLAFAEKYAEKLIAIGLLHSTAYPDTEERKEKRKKGIEAIEKDGAYAFIQKTTPDLFTEEFKNKHAQVVQDFIEKGKDFTQQSLTQYYTAMMNRPERTGIFTNTKIPVLFIAGEKDKAVPKDDILEQVHLPEVSYIHVLKHAAHMGLWEEVETFNTSVKDFIYEVAEI